MDPVSAVLTVQDEERHLLDALESVAFCDEILVVDSGSTDRTREIAGAAGARVVVNAPFPGFREQKNLATRLARHEWVLVLDGDERVTPGLRDEILALSSSGFEQAGYKIPRVAFYLGRWIRGTDWYHDLILRLFDRRRGSWQGGLVHESVRVDGPVGRLRGEIQHHPYADIGEHWQTIDRYSSLWARQAFEAGRRTHVTEALAVTFGAFLRNYILRRGFLLGRVGITVSVLNTFYTFAKYAKLMERQDRAASG